MLLGFKRQFAGFVEEGSKTHTIRSHRKIPIKVGDRLDCYVDPRQKTMRLLGRWPCVKVEPIRIVAIPKRDAAWELSISINGITLDHDEAVAFAWRDGFRPVRECDALIAMGHFWAKMRRQTIFEGPLIHWQYVARSANAQNSQALDTGQVERHHKELSSKSK
jgi:hypothetical protein